jgi:hypothetical protein
VKENIIFNEKLPKKPKRNIIDENPSTHLADTDERSSVASQ